MTKNPLALVAGALIMLLGIGMALFFTYHIFIEEHLFKSRAELSKGTIVRKEIEYVRQAVFTSLESTKPTTGAPAVPAVPTTTSTSSTAATTPTTADILQTKYHLHYAFLAAGSTVPVTGVYDATERQYNAMEAAQPVDVLYIPGRAQDEHRVQVPVEFGSSFWAGISVLLFGCLFVAYLGWCFIFPEEEYDEPVSAAERKREKRKKGGK